MTLKQIMAELKKHGNEQTRKIYARHGAREPMFGVKIADLKVVAKKIRGEQELACKLYETGNYDAMYLAGIIADGAQMTKRQLQAWASAGQAKMMCSHTVPGVASESPHARDLAVKWINAKKEALQTCGWNTYTAIISTRQDEDLDLDEVTGLLNRVVDGIGDAPNETRYAMNGFVIAVGAYVKPLLKKAKAAAKMIGKVEVDVGETECKVPLATEYIAKIEKAGRVGKKRKSAKC